MLYIQIQPWFVFITQEFWLLNVWHTSYPHFCSLGCFAYTEKGTWFMVVQYYLLIAFLQVIMPQWRNITVVKQLNLYNVVRTRVSAILILEVFWNVMNKQIASNRDLKMVAQKSQLSDKTKNVIDYQEKSIVISSCSKQRADTGIKHKDLHTKLTKPTSRCRVTWKKRAVSRLLSTEHRNRRLQFAKLHVNCHIYPIQVVIWTAMNQDFDLISMMDFGVYGEKIWAIQRLLCC